MYRSTSTNLTKIHKEEFLIIRRNFKVNQLKLLPSRHLFRGAVNTSYWVTAKEELQSSISRACKLGITF